MLEPFVTSGRLSLQNQRRNKKVSLRIEATAVYYSLHQICSIDLADILDLI